MCFAFMYVYVYYYMYVIGDYIVEYILFCVYRFQPEEA